MKDNYRDLWQYATRTKIPEGYVIHHLNFKHEDSRIGNIIALPASLHLQFHQLVRNQKNKVELYYQILDLNFDQKYLKYMKKIDKKLTQNVIKQILMKSVGIGGEIDLKKIKCRFFY